MKIWWEGLSGLEHVYFIVSAIATLFLILQIILIVIGFAGDGDIDVDIDGGISLFTVKSVTAFFAIGGWTGMVIASCGGKEWLVVTGSIIAGILAFFLVVFLLKQITKLQSSGNIIMENAIGKNATVYVSVPENMSGKGKITMIIQEKYCEFDAMTEGRKLNNDEIVTINKIIGDAYVVEPIKKGE